MRYPSHDSMEYRLVIEYIHALHVCVVCYVMYVCVCMCVCLYTKKSEIEEKRERGERLSRKSTNIFGKLQKLL